MRLVGNTVVALSCAAALASCGGHGPAAPSTPSSLSTFDRALVLQQVVATAASAFLAGSPAQKADSSSAPLGNLHCDSSCAGDACTLSCPIDEQLACPAGGSATDKGRIAGTLGADLSGEAALDAVQGFAGCRPSASLTIDGAPGTTATGTARFDRGRLADEQSVRIRGAVAYSAPDGSGTCAVDVSVTFSLTRHGSVTGTACGGTVSESF
jgi:hypothetical protein